MPRPYIRKVGSAEEKTQRRWYPSEGARRLDETLGSLREKGLKAGCSYEAIRQAIKGPRAPAYGLRQQIAEALGIPTALWAVGSSPQVAARKTPSAGTATAATSTVTPSATTAPSTTTPSTTPTSTPATNSPATVLSHGKPSDPVTCPHCGATCPNEYISYLYRLDPTNPSAVAQHHGYRGDNCATPFEQLDELTTRLRNARQEPNLSVEMLTKISTSEVRALTLRENLLSDEEKFIRSHTWLAFTGAVFDALRPYPLAYYDVELACAKLAEQPEYAAEWSAQESAFRATCPELVAAAEAAERALDDASSKWADEQRAWRREHYLRPKGK